jgi:4-amino-4-deoxy-L-arabinose transferase-like glycosyltransferase
VSTAVAAPRLPRARAEALVAAPWLPGALVVLLAAALRLPGVGRVHVNPFYDAAVRSMGTSWRAFITGAIDPNATIAVDKPPVDLWLQVASTKLLGFTPLALHLPEALGGILAVGALHEGLRVLFGRRPAVAGALVLAVLPMAVITSRSDTMDSVMAGLVLVAFALTAHAVVRRRPWLLVAAGAALGLAFEVKLFEALIPAPALVLLWWLGSAGTRRARLTALAGAGAALTAVALAWLVALSLVPGPKPWAFGSTNGSAWNATFVYDGLDRLRPPKAPAPPPPADDPRGHRTRAVLAARHHAAALAVSRHVAALDNRPAPPGPGRLFAARAHLGRRVGVALGLALAAWAFAALAGIPRGLDRPGRAGWWALSGWLVTGALLFSAQSGLKPRYLEALDPAIAAVLGLGLVLGAQRLAARRPARGALLRGGGVVLLGAAALALGSVSVDAAVHRAETAGAPGALPSARLGRLSGYLQAHRGGARYETASLAVGKAASLIARDGQPILVLIATDARSVVPPGTLERAVALGEVRFALLGSSCTSASTDRVLGCSPAARWIRAHGIDVSRAAGQPHSGLVYALGPLSAGRPRGTTTSGASTRTRALPRGRPHRATRARRRRCGRGSPPSRSHSRSNAARRRSRARRASALRRCSRPGAATGRGTR